MDNFLRVVFNEQHSTAASSQNLSAFVNHVQQHTVPAVEALLTDVTRDNSEPGEGSAQVSTLSFLTQIITIIKGGIGNKVTIDQIVAESFATSKSTLAHGSATDRRNRQRKIVFHAIAVATMLHKVVRDDMTTQFWCQSGLNTTRKFAIDLSERPILALLKQLGPFHASLFAGPGQRMGLESEPQQQAVLDAANLSISALYQIGRLSFTWVDSLAQHLEFDQDLRQLGFFRFPSFCLAARNSGGDSMLFW